MNFSQKKGFKLALFLHVSALFSHPFKAVAILWICLRITGNKLLSPSGFSYQSNKIAIVQTALKDYIIR